MADREKILSSVDSLPTLPTAVTRLAELMGNDRSKIGDFEKALRPDAALTTNLLRVANSAFFRRAREIGTVRQAIAMLGQKRLFEIVMTASFSSVIPKNVPGYDVDAKQFWFHNISVAILAERLAVELDFKNKDMVFTAGLLHDIGKLVIGVYLAAESPKMMEQLRAEASPFVEIERSLLDIDHMETGGEIAKKWNLPEEIEIVAQYHHDTENPAIGKYQPLVDTVHIADGLAHMLGYGEDVGELSRRLETGAVSRSGLGVRRLEKIASDADDAIRDMLSLFSG